MFNRTNIFGQISVLFFLKVSGNLDKRTIRSYYSISTLTINGSVTKVPSWEGLWTFSGLCTPGFEEGDEVSGFADQGFGGDECIESLDVRSEQAVW